jgi:AAA domain/Bifunctional DNA primase/polymerase, N-terminal
MAHVMSDISDTEFEELPPREPAWMAASRATACRKRLLAAGFSPVPVNGKAPPIVGWQDVEATVDMIQGWESNCAHATNTGILTRHTAAIDIDVVDPAVADEMQQLAERMIGTSPVRIGQAPKRAMLYRADVSFEKIATPVYTSPDGRAHKVEILCDGQQIVVDGTHPITQEPYKWLGGELGSDLKRDALPVLSPEKAAEFIVAAARCLSAYGWTPKKKPNGDAAGIGGGQRIASERERAYARATLDGCADELALAEPGERNDTLNKKAFRLGTMVARDWLSTERVFGALLAAADACGLNEDDGEEATRKTIQSGLENGQKFPHPDLPPISGHAPNSSNSWKYHRGEAAAPPRWLIKNVLPEIGVGIMSGMWGSFKTTIALELSVCVMAALSFAGQFRVKRPGAALYIALEGAGTLEGRLSTIARHHGTTGRLPFASRGDCPPLTNKNAVDAICSFVSEAAIELKRQFDVPVSLIWIDTLITAAGFASGEDNDAAAAQFVMTGLRDISQRTGAMVVGIDHFGKVMESGTRGSSAKEGAADTVIALLADRAVGGAVANTRLAMRKQRDGMSGFEVPFTVRIAEIGTDEDGDPVTAPVVEWQASQQTSHADIRWTQSMQLLRRVLMTILVDSGQTVRPFSDGPEVRACDIRLVRTEYYRQYTADGTERRKAEARRKAFNRSIKDAQARGVVACREVDGTQLIWLATQEGADG